MSVESNLSIIRERKDAILNGDAALIAEQKKAGKLTARERVDKLLDSGSFVELDVLCADAGVITGYGTIDGDAVYVYAQDLTVNGGAVGEKHAKKVLKAMELAQKLGCPIIGLLDSAGAKLDEGVQALNAYAAIAAKAAQLSGVVPQLTAVMGPCGGTASVIAEISDFVVQSAKGELFVNGPLVVSAVSGKKVTMNEIAGSEASIKSGAAMLSCGSDEETLEALRKICALLPRNNLDEAVFTATDTLDRTEAQLNALENADDVRAIIKAVADQGEYIELYSEFAPSMITAIGKLGGRTVAFIANDPTHDEGRLTVYGCKKAAKLVSFCDAFSIPVITLVNSNGMKISCAPQGELARAAAALLQTMSDATNAKLALITGNAIGMAYASMAAKAVCDIVYAWPGAVVSAVTTPIATQLLLGDEMTGADDAFAKRAELEEKYARDIADGVNAAKNGYVDDVIEPASTRKFLGTAIEMLSSKRENRTAKKHGVMPL